MKKSTFALVFVGAAATIAGTAQADLMANGGFETMVSTTGSLPNGQGYWRGDVSDIVTSENGINPYEGVCMLRFNNTTSRGASAAVGGELWQIMDMSAYQSAIRAGNGSVDAGAFFNRNGGANVDTMFSVGVFAYAGAMNSFPTQWGHTELGSAQQMLFSDSNLESWEHSAVSMILPEATDFVVIRVGATENVFNDLSGIEFGGHYVDGVHFQFNTVPAPSAILGLLPVGLMGIGRRRRTA